MVKVKLAVARSKLKRRRCVVGAGGISRDAQVRKWVTLNYWVGVSVGVRYLEMCYGVGLVV